MLLEKSKVFVWEENKAREEFSLIISHRQMSDKLTIGNLLSYGIRYRNIFGNEINLIVEYVP